MVYIWLWIIFETWYHTCCVFHGDSRANTRVVVPLGARPTKRPFIVAVGIIPLQGGEVMQ